MAVNKKWLGTTDDVATGANYSPAGVPVGTDSLLVDGTATFGMLTNLATLAAVTLASLTIKKNAPAVGTSTAKLQVGATLVNIGEPNIDGTTAQGSFVGLDLGAVATNVTVWDTATQGTGSMPPVQLAGSNAANKLTVKAGRVGVAVGFGDTANFPELDVVGPTAKVVCGTGCSLTTLNQLGGELTVNSAWTTLNQTDGIFTHQGTGNAGTANIGGTAYLNSTGTFVAGNVTGALDMSGNPAARTAPAAGVIPIKAFKGSTVNINNGVKLSISCTVQPQKCSVDEIFLRTWPDTTLAFS